MITYVPASTLTAEVVVVVFTLPLFEVVVVVDIVGFVPVYSGSDVLPFTSGIVEGSTVSPVLYAE